jgi:hypothetical protein
MKDLAKKFEQTEHYVDVDGNVFQTPEGFEKIVELYNEMNEKLVKNGVPRLERLAIFHFLSSEMHFRFLFEQIDD